MAIDGKYYTSYHDIGTQMNDEHLYLWEAESEMEVTAQVWYPSNNYSLCTLFMQYTLLSALQT